MAMQEEYEWDEAKRLSNLDKHRVDFAAIGSFEWDSATVYPDDRYDEPRWLGYGYIEDTLHVVVFTERGERTRIISLREADPQEVIDHG